MRALIQRSKQASVTIAGEITGSISHGLVVLLGVEHEDTAEDAEWLAGKIAQMCIFSDAEGKMNLSVKDIGGELLVVSQFTLAADTSGGNRPSFKAAAAPDDGRRLYDYFVAQARAAHPVLDEGLELHVARDLDPPGADRPREAQELLRRAEGHGVLVAVGDDAARRDAPERPAGPAPRRHY